MKRFFSVFCIVVMVSIAMAMPAPAANFTWLGGTQEFMTSTNWTPEWTGGVDTLRIDDNNVATSPILSSNAGTLTELYVGSATASDPGVEFTPPTTTGGLLTIQTGGLMTVNGKIDVGVVGPVTGESTLKMTGGTLTQGGAAFRVGVLNNKGTLDMSGDAKIVHESGGSFHIGALDGGVGVMNMTDTSVLAIYATDLFVGYLDPVSACSGELNMSGGANIGVNVYNTLHVGYGAGTTGKVNMSGGSSLGWFAGNMYIGEAGGTGTLKITESSGIYQNAYTASYGEGAGSTGHLIMTGSATTPGAAPLIRHRGETYFGRGGGAGDAVITNATYWSEVSHVYLGNGSGSSGTMTLTTTTGSPNAASLVVGGHLYIGYENSYGELNIGEGSNVNVNLWIPIAHWDGATAGTAEGVVNMNGGSLVKNNVPGTYVAMGMGGTGTWNQNGGTAIINAPTVLGQQDVGEGGAGGTGTLNLNGGVYATTRIYNGFSGSGNAHGRVNFNGGTLQVVPNGFEFCPGLDFVVLRTAPDLILSVKNPGAVIDTNNAEIVVSVPFTENAESTGGGLTKIGKGTMSLTAQSTYTGSTVVKDGTLQFNKVVHQLAATLANAEGNRGGDTDPSPGPYALGRDFGIKPDKQIVVTQLGVFDDLGNGLAGTHVVHLTDLVYETDTAVTFTPEASGTYKNGFRFITLDTPLTLLPGNYKIWVDIMGGPGGDKFGQNMSIFDLGSTDAFTWDADGLTSCYSATPGVRPNDLWGANNTDATFVYYDPSSIIPTDVLLPTTPVLLGGVADSTPTLDLQGTNQQIASLADVAGSVVKGVVTNSLTDIPVVLTLGATSGSTSYTGAVDGNLSLVKNGDGTQSLTGPLTYTGDTTVNAGTLIVSKINNPTGSVIVTGGTLTAGSLKVGTLAIGGAAAAAAVPEPNTLVLLALAGLSALLVWVRK